MVFGSHLRRPARRVYLPVRQPTADYANTIVWIAQRRSTPAIIRNSSGVADKRKPWRSQKPTSSASSWPP
jgi:hypothetical protein